MVIAAMKLKDACSLEESYDKPSLHEFSGTSVVSALYDPMDRGPPGSSVQGILEMRILEWVAMPSSRGSS